MERTLLEYADCRGLTLGIDRESGVIRGVKILGVESRNGRTYLPSALEQARLLYEGAKVNVNHPKGSPLGPRDYQDRIGVIRNVAVVTESGLFGDLHFNPRHAVAGQLEWDARHAPENVGLSHNVLARTAQRDDRLIVEAITRVVSVDLVADPATTHGLFEEANPAEPARNDESPLAELTAERLCELRPDLAAALQEELRRELDSVRTETAATLRATEARHRKRLLCERLLHEFQLQPDDAVVEFLSAAEDEPAMRSLLTERLRPLRSCGPVERRGPCSREQSGFDHAGPRAVDAASFVRLITG